MWQRRTFILGLTFFLGLAPVAQAAAETSAREISNRIQSLRQRLDRFRGVKETPAREQNKVTPADSIELNLDEPSAGAEESTVIGLEPDSKEAPAEPSGADATQPAVPHEEKPLDLAEVSAALESRDDVKVVVLYHEPMADLILNPPQDDHHAANESVDAWEKKWENWKKGWAATRQSRRAAGRLMTMAGNLSR